MNKNFLTIGLLILLPLLGSSQNFADALRYSSVNLEGTARSGGMGNAFGALGGDFTAAGINPAGLGIYRSSEFSLTPGFGMTEVNSLYLNNPMSDNNYKLGLSNISYVATFSPKSGAQNGLISVNIGVGYNRLKDFNSMALAKGYNAQSSFMDHITANANNGIWDDFYEELAWQTYVLDKYENTGIYYNDLENDGYGQAQQKSFTRKGAMDEFTLGLGLNFNHKFYVGASLGIVDLYYKESTSLYEWDENGDISYLNDFTFDSFLRTYGTGYNFKLGAIFKPVNEVRLGASVSTPTFFNLHDEFETYMESFITWENNKSESFSSDRPFMEYDYDLVTPFKATLSGAVVVAKNGLVSADVEYVDFSIAKLRNGGNGEDFIQQNEDINEIFKPVTNFRVGGEYRFTEAFSGRAGFEYYPSAFNSTAFGKSQENAGENLTVLAAGIGYRSGGFFFDIAYRHSAFSEYNYLYPAPTDNTYPVPKMAKFDNKINKVLLTLGFRF